ncbi:Crotonobetainyl-CoA:carnitine CoA-transferase CaiB [Thermomonospora echinospora]|uniref:Crotonobetainyl-CoA:carnitine CoA-transferase CaiB n=1 Tax=Thermomonospora echinospora TaxID=1992 RepID=A0A1H6DGA3_9ACTN|nr:CoA transferase [Thermomonospora echinospora]SEG83803.1 Crotonobetainyl-CoA:carnitine CoA-transferase CaiB [Thermomonospora echinospora]
MKHTGPLSGVRVVDLTAMVMGPYCTQIMADMGADVIKVEPPAGDNTRHISVGPEPGMGGVFVNVNRGKRSVLLDLRRDEAKDRLRALIGRSDVFIHSMRAKAIAGLGFGYPEVAAVNPSIVYTNCYGYGRRGPDADLTAYDDTIQAECGLPSVQERLTGEASYVGTILADKVAGLTALYATMMALFHRERTGEGQEVEVGMFETMAAFMLVEHANGAMFSPPLGPAAYPRAVTPNRRPYRTKDGHISALVYNDKQWSAFVGAVRPAWAGERFATLQQRARQIDTVYALLGETFLERTTRDWLDLLRSLDIPAAPVRTLDELFDNPHLNEAGFFETVDTPNGPVRFPGPPAWFSRTPGRVAGPAPRLGAHTREVMDEIGGVAGAHDARPGDAQPDDVA